MSFTCKSWELLAAVTQFEDSPILCLMSLLLTPTLWLGPPINFLIGYWELSAYSSGLLLVKKLPRCPYNGKFTTNKQLNLKIYIGQAGCCTKL